jgi:hypothetical protein
MPAALGKFTCIQNKDAIGMPYGRKSMGNDDQSPLMREFLQ